MTTPTLEPPEDFTELVRDALLHLYDPARLQLHPLLAVSAAGQPAAGTRGPRLRQDLLAAIEALHPGSGVATTSRAWRAFRILELRYVEGYDVASAAKELALGHSQYHREHHRALQAAAALLWERWELASRWPAIAAPPLGPTLRGDLARREADQLIPEGGSERVDLMDALLGVVGLLEPLCASRAIELRLDLPERLPLIGGPRVALRQALLGVLAHAVEVSAGGPVAVLAGYRDGRLMIRMTGLAGGALDALVRGFAESRAFVEALQGVADFHLAAGTPARWEVVFTFPASPQQTLLVVDNNADFVQLVDRSLTGHGWEVVGAADVDEAATLARQRQPQAILLDIVLPGRDGWELLVELKRLPATRTIPVLVCSVLDEPAVAISLGAVAYLHKPVDQRRLLAALGSLGGVPLTHASEPGMGEVVR